MTLFSKISASVSGNWGGPLAPIVLVLGYGRVRLHPNRGFPGLPAFDDVPPDGLGSATTRAMIASHNRRSVAWYHETIESPQKNQMTAAIAR